MNENIPIIAESLNDRALRCAAPLFDDAGLLRVVETRVAGARVVDCGAQARGGVHAGLVLARVCLSGLGELALVPGLIGGRSWPHVQVVSDHPVAACLASQYAGWQISVGKFFAMGSGPMRAASGKEALFDRIGHRERPKRAIGVLECRKAPTDEVVTTIAEACGLPPAQLTLLYAPTASLAGTVQVVARSLETALHKLAELHFDLARIVAGQGTAPLAPVAKDDLAAIGRTNDAILYGGRVWLAVTGDDASLQAVGPLLPSCAARDHGVPFGEIFARYHHDFYAVDPHLFSPAEVVLQNVETGNVHAFGRVEPEVVERSFGLLAT